MPLSPKELLETHKLHIKSMMDTIDHRLVALFNSNKTEIMVAAPRDLSLEDFYTIIKKEYENVGWSSVDWCVEKSGSFIKFSI